MSSKNSLKKFEALLKPKNDKKCKTCLKLIKMRLETIRKKKNAVQKFLKNDIVDLLRNSLDYNAYGRAEGFLVEQNMSTCYEFIAKFVGCIYVNVRDLYKQSDCPEECKEAIPSLIYAAARFSDLPELRELRTLFQEKFGNTLEPYTSQEFIERLRQDPPSKEMKIQLLHELAQEFSIEWDRKALEQRLYLPISHQEKEKPNHDDQLLEEKEKPKHDDQQKDNGDAKLQTNIKDDNINHDDPWWRMLRSTVSETTTPNWSSRMLRSTVSETTTPDWSPMMLRSTDSETTTPDRSSMMLRSTDTTPDRSPMMLRSTDSETTTPDRSSMMLRSTDTTPDRSSMMLRGTDSETTTPDRSSIDDQKACSSASEDDEAEIKRPFSYKSLLPPYLIKAHKDENNLKKSPEALTAEKPVPRSVRRRPLRPPPEENTVKDFSKTGSSFEEKEIILDELLMQYIKKQSNDKEQKKTYRKSISSVPTTMREKPLPQRTNSVVPEFFRTTSEVTGHVHPSLPDYDDLSARLASLRRT